MKEHNEGMKRLQPVFKAHKILHHQYMFTVKQVAYSQFCPRKATDVHLTYDLLPYKCVVPIDESAVERLQRLLHY